MEPLHEQLVPLSSTEIPPAFLSLVSGELCRSDPTKVRTTAAARNQEESPKLLGPFLSHLLSRLWKGKSNEDVYSLRAPCLRKLWPQGQTPAPQCLDSNPGSPLQVVWVWTSYFCVSFVIYKMGMIMVCPSRRFYCCLSFDGGRCKLTWLI